MKFFLIPDYEKDKSIMIMKAHHSLGDGLGFAAFFLSISENYNSKYLNSFKPIPLALKLMIFLFSPLIIIYYGIKLLFARRDFNAIKNDTEFSGIRKGAYRLDFDLKKIKDYSKLYNVTVNEFWMAILSKSTKNYLENRKST